MSVCACVPDDYINVSDPRTKSKSVEEIDFLLTDAATLLDPARGMRVDFAVDMQTRTRKEWRAACAGMNTNVVIGGTVLGEPLFQVRLPLTLQWRVCVCVCVCAMVCNGVCVCVCVFATVTLDVCVVAG